MPKSVKRDDEEFARGALHAYLLDRSASIQWDPITCGSPDYFVTINSVRFAVEVTALMERFYIGGALRSAVEISHSLTRFVRDVELEAQNAGVLRGAYALAVAPMDDLPARWNELKSRAVQFIRATRDVDSTDTEVICENRAGSWRIKKLAGHEDFVAELVDGGAKWEGEANEDVRRLLAERVSVKEHKLSAIAEPAVLLLVDAYPFAEDEGWEHAVSHQVRASRFCAGMRVRGQGTLQVLWYRQPWLSWGDTPAS